MQKKSGQDEIGIYKQFTAAHRQRNDRGIQIKARVRKARTKQRN